jgi:hypothetical protein
MTWALSSVTLMGYYIRGAIFGIVMTLCAEGAILYLIMNRLSKKSSEQGKSNDAPSVSFLDFGCH